MKVIYSDKHRLHAPPHELEGAGKLPHPDEPQRAEAILRALGEAGFDEAIAPRQFGPEAFGRVHDPGYVEYLAGAYEAWVAAGEPATGVIPHTFAIRPVGRPPAEPVARAGHYCLDTGTPIIEHTFEAAQAAACCALTGAELLLAGERCAYALCRPPGHHAGRDYCAGFCYLNNAAIAAARLAEDRAKVAILDVDYHHGNGTQDIFYDSGQVLCVSLHGDPRAAWPHLWGWADETGAGAGRGCNVNLPLPPETDEPAYLAALDRGLAAVREFGAELLVLSLGVDTAAGDPLGEFNLSAESFGKIGRRVAGLAIPTLAVQEGGYSIDKAGRCVVNVLKELR